MLPGTCNLSGCLLSTCPLSAVIHPPSCLLFMISDVYSSSQVPIIHALPLFIRPSTCYSSSQVLVIHPPRHALFIQLICIHPLLPLGACYSCYPVPITPPSRYSSFVVPGYSCSLSTYTLPVVRAPSFLIFFSCVL